MSEYDEHIDKIGTMVVDPRGRIGMITNVYIKACRIKYGADGPHATHYKKSMRVATNEEIRDAGLEGVGRAWPPE